MSRSRAAAGLSEVAARPAVSRGNFFARPNVGPHPGGGRIANQRVADIVYRGSPDEVQRALSSLACGLRACANWIAENRERSDKTEALAHLLTAAAFYVELCGPVDNPIQVLALSTRSVFELDLRTQHILQSEDNLKRWFAEALVDRIEVYEGVLTLAQHPSDEFDHLRGEIERTRAVAPRHGLSLDIRPLATRNLARAVDREPDYLAFYKFYSKLVHPSSYAVNYPAEELNSWVYRDTLAIYLQLNGHDLLERVREDAGVPVEVVRAALTKA